MCLLVVMLSSITKTSKTGDMPMPQPAARSNRLTGMALTLVDARIVDPAQRDHADPGITQLDDDLAGGLDAPRPVLQA